MIDQLVLPSAATEDSPENPSTLADCERIIADGLQTFIQVGRALKQIRDEKLWAPQYDSFTAYLKDRWDIKRATVYQRIAAVEVVDTLLSASADNGDVVPIPIYENQVRPLIGKPPEFQRAAWRRAVEVAGGAATVKTPLVEEVLKNIHEEEEAGVGPSEVEGADVEGVLNGAARAFELYLKKTDSEAQSQQDRMLIALPKGLIGHILENYAIEVGHKEAEYEMAVPLHVFDGEPPLKEILEAYRSLGRKHSFNTTNEHVDWARFTVNPVTGCLHGCYFCYARDIANRRYAQAFKPTFHPGRLLAFEQQQKAPNQVKHPREKNVFTCSMADLFGRWVPEWITRAVLEAAGSRPDYDFLFLTKFPKKLSEFTFPDNAWIGATAIDQEAADQAERYFKNVNAKVKWLSCEPLKGDIHFESLQTFNGVVIGSLKGYGGQPDEPPQLRWVLNIMQQALNAGVEIYWKDNLQVPKDLPGQRQAPV